MHGLLSRATPIWSILRGYSLHTPKEIFEMPSSHPIIVVPGVTATYLRDLYPLPPETIWAVIRKKYDRVKLHPDNLRYEARQPAVVRPDCPTSAPLGQFDVIA